MKLYWRHFFGNQKRNDIILSDVWAEVKYYEEKDAIESGWLYQSGYWYQSRSTRLNLKGYDKKINLPKNYSYRFESPDKIDMNKLDSIYKQYITVKNFIDFWNPLKDTTRSKFVIIYDDSNEPVAFTKMNMYNGTGLITMASALNAPRIGEIGEWLNNAYGFDHLFYDNVEFFDAHKVLTPNPKYLI